MALTYESMQLPDRAAVQWQRLVDLGESIGAPYTLAQMKLRQNNAGAGTEAGLMMAAAAATSPRGDVGGSGSLAEAPGSGFAANALLRIAEARQEEMPDAAADKKVALRTVIKNKPGTPIDPRRVKVYAEFYDLVDGKDIVQTDADTGFQWLSSPVDWSDDAPEILETTYVRAKGAGAANSSTPLLPPPPVTPIPVGGKGKRGGSSAAGNRNAPASQAAGTPLPGPVRTYVGYVVRLYYDRQLQDCKAEPDRLLQQFPPPPTLPAE